MKGAKYGYRERVRSGYVDNGMDWYRRRYSYCGDCYENAWVAQNRKSTFDKGEELCQH